MPILSIFTIISLVILYKLGAWQWERYQFKLAEEAKPAPIAIALNQAIASPKEFLKVIIEGEIIPRAINIQTNFEGRLGERYIVPITTNSGIILADIGWLDDSEFSKFKLSANHVRFEGVLRHAHKPNAYVPDNNLGEHKFYWAQIPEIAKALEVQPITTDYYVAISQFDLLDSGKKTQNPWADPKGVNYIEPGRHLGYALTWWGLGISLILVYMAFHIKQGRLGFNKP